MQKQLSARLERLERNSGEHGEAFFLLWLRPGENVGEAVQRERHARPDLSAVPIYVFKWAGEDPPPARWVTIEGLSDAELAKVVDGICETAISAGLDPKQGGPSDLSDLSDRELVARALEAFGTPDT